MKRRLLSLALSVMLVPGVSIAQSSSKSSTDLAAAAARRFPQPVRVGDLLQRQVLQPLESQPSLGRVRQVVRRPNGMIEIIVDYGGILGFGTRPIAVPVDGMTLLGEYMEIVSFTPEELGRFTTFDGAGVMILAADEMIRVGLAKPSH